MPGPLLRGALVEYSSDVLGPLPNIVVFQFNPEQIVRTLNMADGGGKAEPAAAKRKCDHARVAGAPVESFPVTAHFSAADDLGKGGAVSVIPRAFGVGPQLAALEKMVYPAGGIVSGAVGAVVDAVGSALGKGGEDKPTRPVPPEQVPRILFIWGLVRVLPVTITSMTITEQKFDFLLNPVQAQVEIGMEIATIADDSDDRIGKGALIATQTVKDGQALLNLAKAGELAIDVITF
jgi:hypothetical protein